MTSDERIAAIGTANGYDCKTILVDVDTLEFHDTLEGWGGKITSDDKFLFAATNRTRDITLYQMQNVKLEVITASLKI